MCVSRTASSCATDSPREVRLSRRIAYVASGPGSTMARCPPDSSNAAAMECGRPTQFRSRTLMLFIVRPSIAGEPKRPATDAVARAAELSYTTDPVQNPWRMGEEMVIAPVVLEGRHVRLVPLTLEHTQGLAAVGLDDDLWKWIPVPVRTPEELRT